MYFISNIHFYLFSVLQDSHALNNRRKIPNDRFSKKQNRTKQKERKQKQQPKKKNQTNKNNKNKTRIFVFEIFAHLDDFKQ